MTHPLPELDRAAIVAADLAFVEHLGPTTMDRVTAAVRAYEWAKTNPGWSLDELRTALTTDGSTP